MSPPFRVAVAFLLTSAAWCASALITDEEARSKAVERVKQVIPDGCHSTFRQERLEDSFFSARFPQIKSATLNQGIFIYEVTNDICYTLIDNGKGNTSLLINIVDHEGSYGYVAVDGATQKTYWFRSNQDSGPEFNRFVEDIGVRVFSGSDAELLASTYRKLVKGPYTGNELYSQRQLQRLAEDNFASAYSPYESNTRWQKKFQSWWKAFLRNKSEMRYQVQSHSTENGFEVTGQEFQGFSLTMPRSDPPPKGNPSIREWHLLVSRDGRITETDSKIIY